MQLRIVNAKNQVLMYLNKLDINIKAIIFIAHITNN